MLHWNFITLASLWAIAYGHVTIGGSKASTYERVPVSVSEKDLYQQDFHRSLALEDEFETSVNLVELELLYERVPECKFHVNERVCSEQHCVPCRLSHIQP